MQLFEYAIWCDEKLDKDGEVVEKARVIQASRLMVATDEKAVGIRAAREIPAATADAAMDRVQISIRPF